jgi:hypothetical protein
VLRLRPELAPLREELDRLGVSYNRKRVGTYAALHDLGDVVWIKGPLHRGLSWEGPPDEALEIVRRLPDDIGTIGFWRALEQLVE